MIGARILATAVFALLAACAAPQQRVPNRQSAPAAWSAQIERAPETAAINTAWWQELADPELNHLVGLSLQNNADLGVAAARVRQSRALVQTASARRLPRVELQASAARERTPVSIFRDAQAGEQRIPSFTESRFAGQFQASYEIDLLGRLALGERAAGAELAASEADAQAVRQWLAGEVVLAYGELRLAEDRTAIAQELRAQMRKILTAEQARLVAGLITREVLREAEHALAEREEALITLAHERHAASARLAELSGSATLELPIQRQPDYYARLALSGSLTPGLPAAALARRADLAAAWQRVLAASDQAEHARLERYPTLMLTGSSGYLSETLRRWLTGDAHGWLAQVVLQGPLLDGRRARARDEQAQGLFDERLAQYRKLFVQALVEAETALSATQSAKQRVTLAQLELVRRNADRAASANAIIAGVASKPMLWQSEIAQLSAAESLGTRRYELLVAWAKAQQALGR